MSAAILVNQPRGIFIRRYQVEVLKISLLAGGNLDLRLMGFLGKLLLDWEGLTDVSELLIGRESLP